MRPRLFAALVVCVCAIAFSASAQAVVVYSNAPVDGQVCSISDDRVPVEYGGMWYVGQETAGVFSLSAPAAIIGVNWWGAYGHNPDPTSDDFVIRFYEDVEGYPDYAPIAEYQVDVTRTLTDLQAGAFGSHDGGDVYAYSAWLTSALDLNADTTYYLSVHNDTYDGQNSSLWGWLLDGAGVNIYRGEGPSYAYDWYYSSLPYNTSFELLATPEPMSLIFFGTGLAAAGIVLRRRR